MIGDFCEQLLGFQLNLVRDDITDGSRPISCQRVITRNPLGTDVRVDLHGMRCPVIACSRKRQV